MGSASAAVAADDSHPGPGRSRSPAVRRRNPSLC